MRQIRSHDRLSIHKAHDTVPIGIRRKDRTANAVRVTMDGKITRGERLVLSASTIAFGSTSFPEVTSLTARQCLKCFGRQERGVRWWKKRVGRKTATHHDISLQQTLFFLPNRATTSHLTTLTTIHPWQSLTTTSDDHRKQCWWAALALPAALPGCRRRTPSQRLVQKEPLLTKVSDSR